MLSFCYLFWTIKEAFKSLGGHYKYKDIMLKHIVIIYFSYKVYSFTFFFIIFAAKLKHFTW